MNKAAEAAVRAIDSLVFRFSEDEEIRDINTYVTGHGRFTSRPASLGFHHTYEGGLVVHTGEVLAKAIELSQSSDEPVDMEVLVTSCVWHDYAKIFEYGKLEDGGYINLPYKDYVGHIVGSYMAFANEAASHYRIDHKKRQAIGHCILAHHGKPEWGSPVEPQTVEAKILHAADYWSTWQGPTREKP